MYPTKLVNCCTEFGSYLEELPNDQEADPGYRHIRLEIITPSGSMRGNVRIRFCPWCGKEFKIEKHESGTDGESLQARYPEKVLVREKI